MVLRRQRMHYCFAALSRVLNVARCFVKRVGLQWLPIEKLLYTIEMVEMVEEKLARAGNAGMFQARGIHS